MLFSFFPHSSSELKTAEALPIIDCEFTVDDNVEWSDSEITLMKAYLSQVNLREYIDGICFTFTRDKDGYHYAFTRRDRDDFEATTDFSSIHFHEMFSEMQNLLTMPIFPNDYCSLNTNKF